MCVLSRTPLCVGVPIDIGFAGLTNSVWTIWTFREVLEPVLREIMPEDIHEKVKHKAYIGVTMLQRPGMHVVLVMRVHDRWEELLLKLFALVLLASTVPTCTLFNSFEDREDFIESLLASCYIPVYFDQGNLGMRYRGRWVCDGGISNFVPSPPGEEKAIKVSCWPDTLGIWDIALDTFRARSPYSTMQCLGLALTPGTLESQKYLEELGREDALRFVEARGLGGDGGT
eukprot:scaffold4066_cov417-Prasinococcus_capsulatus_cf.AAC.16